MTRLAACACGQLSVACEGEPVRISMCHCLECQRRTGSVFGAQARYPREAVTIAGRATEYTRTGDEGGKVTSRFCPVCGSTVYWELDNIPGVCLGCRRRLCRSRNFPRRASRFTKSAVIHGSRFPKAPSGSVRRMD